MSTIAISVEEAGIRLAELITCAQKGDEVVLMDGSQPKARLVALRTASSPRVFGMYQGKIHVSDDFAAPLPDDFWLNGSS